MSAVMSVRPDLASLLAYAQSGGREVDAESESSLELSDEEGLNAFITGKIDLLPSQLQTQARNICIRDAPHTHINSESSEQIPDYLYDTPDSTENIQHTSEGDIEGISFYKLIEQMTGESSELINVFLTTYPVFSNSAEVLSALIERIRIPIPKLASGTERKLFSQCVLTTMDTKLASILKTWGKLWPELFAQNSEFGLTLNEVVGRNKAKSGALNMSSATLNTMFAKAKGRDVGFSDNSTVYSPILPIELDFRGNVLLIWNTTEIARQCTLIDWSYISRVSISECLSRKWEKDGKEKSAGNVVALSKRFASARALFIHSILETDRDNRVKLIKELLEVAHICLSTFFNFETPFIIASVLKSDPILALKKTMMQIKSQPHKEIQKRLSNIYTGDFSIVRQEMAKQCNVPCWLSLRQELARIDILYPDFTSCGLINLQKHKLTSDVIMRLKQYQMNPIQFHRVGMLYDYLEAKNFAIDEVQATHLAEELENS